jgi:outer membrane protein assembly factor BamB
MVRTVARCSTCGADVTDAAARWCGRCGTPLRDPAGRSDERDAQPQALLVLDDEPETPSAQTPTSLRSRLVALAAVATVLGGMVVAQAQRETDVEARGLTPRGSPGRDGIVSITAVSPPTTEEWSITLGLPPRVSPGTRLLPAGEHVLVLDQGRRGGVTAHDAETGRVLWARPDLVISAGPSVVVGDTLVVQDVGQEVVAVGPDGRTRWQEDRPLGVRVAVGDGLVEIPDQRTVRAQDGSDGDIRWETDVTTETLAQPVAVLPGGDDRYVTVLAVRPAGLQLGTAADLEEPHLLVLDAADGSVVREVPLAAGLAWTRDPIAIDGDLAVVADVLDVVFLDLDTGAVLANPLHGLRDRPLSVGVADGRALLLDASGTLVAVAPDGAWDWSFTTDLPAAVHTREGLVQVSGPDRITTLDASDGRVIGSQPVSQDERRGPTGPDGSAYTLRDDGVVVRYGVEGPIEWQVPTPLPESDGPTAAPEGRIAVATGNGVSLFRVADGGLVWTFRSGRADESIADEVPGPAVTDEVVVVAPPVSQPATVGGLYGLQLDTGILAWSRLDDRPLPRGPVTLDRGLVLLPVDTELHGYDPDDGRRALAADGGDLRGAIAGDGGVLVTATQPGATGGAAGPSVRAVTRADRSLKWEAALDACGAPALRDETVLVGTTSGVTALDLLDGGTRWTARVGPVCDALAVTRQGTSVAVVARHELVGLATADGSERWRVRLPAPVAASPVVVGDEVVVPLLDGRLLAVDAATGGTAWQMALSEVPATAPVVVDDRLVLVLRDDRLVALR